MSSFRQLPLTLFKRYVARLVDMDPDEADLLLKHAGLTSEKLTIMTDDLFAKVWGEPTQE